MSKEFDAVLEAAGRKLSPAQEERARLQPVRKEAEKTLRDLNEAIAWARPRVNACSQRLQQAARHGVSHRDMAAHLSEASRIMDQGPNTLIYNVIGLIDGLTDDHVRQRLHLYIPGNAKNARALAGEIRRLVNLAEGQDLRELTEVLRESVGAPGPIPAIEVPERRPLTVAKDFEV